MQSTARATSDEIDYFKCWQTEDTERQRIEQERCAAALQEKVGREALATVSKLLLDLRYPEQFENSLAALPDALAKAPLDREAVEAWQPSYRTGQALKEAMLYGSTVEWWRTRLPYLGALGDLDDAWQNLQGHCMFWSKGDEEECPVQDHEAVSTPVRRKTGMTWQEVADRLERLRSQGEAWTSIDDMRKRLGVPSKQTIHRAVKSSVQLTAWAKRQTAPRAQQGLAAAEVADNTRRGKEPKMKGNEPNPLDDSAEVELRMAFEKASPDERAFLNEIRGATGAFQLWYLEKTTKNQERFRERWNKKVAADSKFKTWFLGLPAKEQVELFDDPGRHQKIVPRV